MSDSETAKQCGEECEAPAGYVCHGLAAVAGDTWRSCQKPLCREHVAGVLRIHLNYGSGDRRSGWYDQPLCASCHERRQARIAEVQRRKAEKSA